ncbi:MAG: acyl-CoA thioesterase II [Pseudomonadota bacterium]
MASAIENLISYLELHAEGVDRFVGQSPQTGRQRVFGGQVIGQAMYAAAQTVPNGRNIHSLHCYFIRPGDPTVPIEYRVDRLRDGRSFSTRQVTAWQHGFAIYSLSASFQEPDDGLEFQVTMPEGIPEPESLMSEEAFVNQFGDRVSPSVKAYWRRERPIELRPVGMEHYISKEPLEPVQKVWVRPTGPVPDSPLVRSAVLAYLSDMTLLDTSLFAHGRSIFDPSLQVASIDHAMWFHRAHALDDWLLYIQDSPSTSGSRGFTRGEFFSRDGILVASTTQEGLIRHRHR